MLPASLPHEVFTRIHNAIPAWEDAKLAIAPICENWGNANYLVTAEDGRRWVMRYSQGDTSELGIYRTAEAKTAAAASRLGVGPELVAYLLPEGHQVTTFLDGKAPDGAWVGSEEGAALVGSSLRKLHEQPDNGCIHSPLDMAHLCMNRAQGLAQRALLQEHLPKLEQVVDLQQQSGAFRRALLHGDCFINNMLRTPDGMRFIDFEFSGIGDAWFDIACLSFQVDEAGLDRLVQAYLGESFEPEHRAAIRRSRYIVGVWDAAWALLQLTRGCTVKDFAAHVVGVVGCLPGLYDKAMAS